MSFHIDNFDEQVQTFDGKNTVHYLLIVCFQRKVQDFKPIDLKLEKTTSLTLNENTLGDVTPCEEVTNRQFKRSEACKNFTCSSKFTECRSESLFIWQCFRSFEHLFVNDKEALYLKEMISSPLGPTSNQPLWNLKTLMLPSFSAMNSLVASVDTSL